MLVRQDRLEILESTLQNTLHNTRSLDSMTRGFREHEPDISTCSPLRPHIPDPALVLVLNSSPVPLGPTYSISFVGGVVRHLAPLVRMRVKV